MPRWLELVSYLRELLRRNQSPAFGLMLGSEHSRRGVTPLESQLCQVIHNCGGCFETGCG